MSKKEDDDKVTMSQCEKKSMVIQGIKDRSKRREARKDPEMGVRGTKGRSGEDPGKIHRSWGFCVQECWRKYREGDKEGKVLV